MRGDTLSPRNAFCYKELNNQVLKNTKKNTEKYRKTTTINHSIHIKKISIQYRPRRYSYKRRYTLEAEEKQDWP